MDWFRKPIIPQKEIGIGAIQNLRISKRNVYAF